MSNSVFVSGSIKINVIPNDFIDSLDNIINQKMKIIIGDAPGVDLKVQKYLAEKKYYNVCIYHIREFPRNNIGSFETKKIDFRSMIQYNNLSDIEKAKINKSERLKQTFKDIEMGKDADYLLVLWDGQSKGSRNNIIYGLENSKKVKVYYNGFLKQEDVTIKNINRIFDDRNGLTITDIKNRISEAIENKYSISNDDMKKYKIDELYPISLKKIENNYDLLKDFIIVNNYRGKKVYKFKNEIIDFMINFYIKKYNEISKNKTFELFDD